VQSSWRESCVGGELACAKLDKRCEKVLDLGVGDTCEQKFTIVYCVFAKTMLSARSPKSTKEVAKKLEDAQLRDEQSVRRLLFSF